MAGHHQAAPHVRVSRINARLSSTANGADSKDAIFDTSSSSSSTIGSSFVQDESSSCSMSTTERQHFGNAICVQTSNSSSVSSSLSYSTGRWCEEERAIPLKKRRVVMESYETSSQSKEKKKKKKKKRKKDAVERKREIGEMEDYKRCNRRDGKRWRCKKMRVKGYSFCKHHLERQRMRNIISCPNSRSNQIKKDKGVKARSISSLLRDTVPLLC